MNELFVILTMRPAGIELRQQLTVTWKGVIYLPEEATREDAYERAYMNLVEAGGVNGQAVKGGLTMFFYCEPTALTPWKGAPA